jgi:hypothetical protein
MRSVIPAILAILLVFGCKPSRVIYAKYGKLKLSEQEVNHYPVSGADVLKFQDCCAIESDVVFLNRAIANPTEQYDVFISVSESLMQNDFAAAQASDGSLEVLSTATCLVNKVKVNAYLLNKAESFVARFTYIETRSGLLVIYDVTSKNRPWLEQLMQQKETYLHEKIRL